MAQYLRPGAYIERADAASSSKLLLRSDVPAFVGIAEKGPLDLPVPIESFRQFQAVFGAFIGGGFLAYSVRAFFDNGGRRCRVVRVASRVFDGPAGLAAQAAALILLDASGTPVWAIRASSEGYWGNQLELALLEEHSADTTIAAGGLGSLRAQVASTAGFTRGSLARISQQDSSGSLREFTRVISFIDEQNRLLYWVHPQPGSGLPYDRSLQGFDAQRPARITSISYRLDVYLRKRLLAMYAGLALVPEHPAYGPTRLAPWRLAGENGEVANVPAVPEPVVIEPLQEVFTQVPQALRIVPLRQLPMRGGQDGLAALSHTDFIGGDFTPQDSDLQRRRKLRGIATLQQVDEVTLLALPDIVIRPEPDPEYRPQPPAPRNPCVPCPPPPEPARQFQPPARSGELPPLFSEAQVFQVQAAMVAHCEQRGDRFAVLDPPCTSPMTRWKGWPRSGPGASASTAATRPCTTPG